MRDEALTALWRWREAILGAGMALLGLWWGLGSWGVLAWIGWALVLLGAAVIWSGVQRLRFGRGGGGQGLVQLDERRLVYFGPLTGGTVDLDDLARLALDRRSRPAHWLLTGGGGEALAIPVDAEGAGVLFDAFASLPGLPSERLIAAQHAKGDAVEVLWERARPRLAR